MPTERDPVGLDGWTYISIYRNQAIYIGDGETTFGYAARDSNGELLFDYSFEKLQAKLDEIHAAVA
jgi:hypothetical protein